jgi:hypothetical protein
MALKKDDVEGISILATLILVVVSAVAYWVEWLIKLFK